MPMTWNDQADAKLLLAILNTTTAKPDYQAIATYMGSDCTPSAIQHRIHRLKERAGNTISSPSSTGAVAGSSPASVTGSPLPRKRGRPPKSGMGGVTMARKKKKVVKDGDGDEEQNGGNGGEGEGNDENEKGGVSI